MPGARKFARAASVAATALVAAFFAPASSAQTQSDGLIVPNERVGAVRLGMTPAEVIAVLGQPRDSGFIGSQGYLNYCDGECRWPHQRIAVSTRGERNEVYSILVQPEGDEYVTVEGVRVGMSEMDVRIRLGNPRQRVRDELLNNGRWFLVYPGLMVAVRDGVGVEHIQICQPRYQLRRADGRRGWCPA